ncbi:MAG: helix-turn-helix domain-containing protein [Desulfobulbaceae bacterium]|nr:helix-turn-helix domain-containing protein [Desulfobulbaceae bacterium]
MINQKSISTETGLHPVSVSRLVTGARRPSPAMACRLEAATDIPRGIWLFGSVAEIRAALGLPPESRRGRPRKSPAPHPGLPPARGKETFLPSPVPGEGPGVRVGEGDSSPLSRSGRGAGGEGGGRRPVCIRSAASNHAALFFLLSR